MMSPICWKYINLVCFSCLVYCCLNGVPVVSQNIFEEYFYRINCTVVDKKAIKTYNTLECAAMCMSDRFCEGFQAVKISYRLTQCLLFNISSEIDAYKQDDHSFVKTHLLHKVNIYCNPSTSTSEMTTIATKTSTTDTYSTTDTNTVSSSTDTEVSSKTDKDISSTTDAALSYITQVSYISDTELSSSTDGTFNLSTTQDIIVQTIQDLMPDTSTLSTTIGAITTTHNELLITQCSVGAAIYISTSNEIWLFFHNYIQIYTSVNDLTTTNFRGEKMTDIFTDAPLDIEAGYFEGNNIFLIKDEEIYQYTSMSKGSTTIKHSSTHSHFGVTVPTAIDAVIVNGNDDLFMFSNNVVTRLEGSQQSTFDFNNNGVANYYKAANNDIRPADVTAGTKTDATTHYIFTGKTISTFTEAGNKGTWNSVGDVICNTL